MTKLKQIWDFLAKNLKNSHIRTVAKKTDIGTIVEVSAEAPKASLEFCIALGLLNPALLPLATGLSFVGLGTKCLNLYRQSQKQQPNIAEDIEVWTAIAFPLAYLESFDNLVRRNDWLRSKIGDGLSGKKIKQQLDQLEVDQLSQELAQQALTNFPESLLGRALNHQLSIYLEQVGLDQYTIPLVTGWVAWETKTHIEELLSYESENIVGKVKLYTTATKEIRANQKFGSIESYLLEQISPNPSDPGRLSRWKVFDEDFKIPDIYVPLKAQLLDSNGKAKKKSGRIRYLGERPADKP
ncbi:MAG: hypothetical protein AAGG00_03810 [Cyanobacteria bacterium P01_H01_bin.150]